MTPRTLASKIVLTAAAVAVASQAATQANAALVYGDYFTGQGIRYLNVTESSSSDPVPPARFGAPDVVGNGLDFDPNMFGATTVGPLPGADLMEGQLNFAFETVGPGNGLQGMTISEGGDFTLDGVGSSITSVRAGLFARIEITEVAGVTLNTPIVITSSTMYATDLLSSPGLNQPWDMDLFVDFKPALMNAGYDPLTQRATAGEVVFNNTLVAFSEGNPGTVAQIAKKDFKVNPVIPEPGSIALLAFGGLACLPRRRR